MGAPLMPVSDIEFREVGTRFWCLTEQQALRLQAALMVLRDGWVAVKHRRWLGWTVRTVEPVVD